MGGLLLIDAYALVGLAGKYASGGGGAGDAGLIFTRWVEAMAGHESLAPTRALPALATPETKANFVKYKRRMTAYKADVERALKRRSTAVSRRKDPAEADRELDQLVRQAHVPLQTLSDAADTGGGGGDGGGGASSLDAELDVTAQLRAFAEGLHPRLGADSAVHLLEGCRDVLGLIAAEVRGAPPPRGRGTSQLRQVSLLLNYERRRRQLSEALADERRVELELAARRQQAAVDAALADERRRSAAAYAKLDAALQAERQETGRLCTEVRRLKAAAREAETAAELRCRSQEKEAAAHFGSIASEAERRTKVAEAQRDDACEEAAQLHGLFAQLEDQLDALRSMRVSGLLEQLQASTRRITELSARRKVTQRKLSDVNLVERNLAVSQRLLSEERAARAKRLDGLRAELDRLKKTPAEIASTSAARVFPFSPGEKKGSQVRDRPREAPRGAPRGASRGRSRTCEPFFSPGENGKTRAADVDAISAGVFLRRSSSARRPSRRFARAARSSESSRCDTARLRSTRFTSESLRCVTLRRALSSVMRRVLACSCSSSPETRIERSASSWSSSCAKRPCSCAASSHASSRCASATLVRRSASEAMEPKCAAASFSWLRHRSSAAVSASRAAALSRRTSVQSRPVSCRSACSAASSFAYAAAERRRSSASAASTAACWRRAASSSSTRRSSASASLSCRRRRS